MHSLTIVFGPTGTSWRLLFKERGTATIAAERCQTALGNNSLAMKPADSAVELEDDFGQIASIPAAGIHGIMLEDLDQSKQAGIELGLHQARAQADMQNAAKADPKIMAHARAQNQGPGILGPNLNGFAR